MELYGRKSGSIPQKIVIHLLEIVLLWVSWWMLLQSGVRLAARTLGIPNSSAVQFRRMLLFAMLILPTAQAIDGIDLLAVVTFLAGSAINTIAEILRKQWKDQPENKGKLYTCGLFKWSMHINYFGDLLWVSAYALLTRNIYSLSIPVFLFCFFAFYNIPKLDSYLRQHYGAAFDEYARKTRKFIPFLY